ncbi:pilin [Allochromatium vinosum]|uniref:Fimbrial protein PilE (MS11 antigen) n=1 Tax=Allochromatium vinosum (strain ATCC 17899 / DSM 180 / NBRC 103801 / NCIMB 10441 / D) TaxID=572477 RepID=D3RSG8_ALLVD|nr:pilin [Allochromatium vinosum]ADC62127.1 fimbrial protein precursor PilE (MS11 antigen) [Allochromatium vinosum DSM 180]
MKKHQQGFTLIELMIVVAIIGILAALALPAYTDYTVRAKVAECVGIISACKTSVSDYYASMNALPADETAAGCATTTTQYCAAPTVVDGVVTVDIDDAAVGGDWTGDGDLVLTPDATVSAWTGGTNADAADYKYLPANFRAAP